MRASRAAIVQSTNKQRWREIQYRVLQDYTIYLVIQNAILASLVERSSAGEEMQGTVKMRKGRMVVAVTTVTSASLT